MRLPVLLLLCALFPVACATVAMGSAGGALVQGSIMLRGDAPNVLVEGPATIVHVMTSGDGASYIYRVDDHLRKEEDCRVPSGRPVVLLAANSDSPIAFSVRRGEAACATLVEGSRLELMWHGRRR